MPATTGISSSDRNAWMTRISNCLIIIVLLSLLAPFSARAQQRGLFLIQNPLQYVDLTYEYRNLNNSSNGTGSSSSDTHILRPKYHIGFDYAIYDPDILSGSFSAVGKADQTYFANNPGTSGSRFEPGYEYDISGTFLNRKPVSVDFISRYHLDTAQPQFSPAYNVDTYYSKLGVRYKGAFLPSTLNYSYTNTATSGLTNDTTTRNTLVTFETNHRYRNLSNTKLYLTYSDQENTQSNSYSTQHSYTSLELSNNLAFSVLKKALSLGSYVSLQKDNGDYSGTSMQWREMFSSYLGRSLQVGVNNTFYRLNRSSTDQTTENIEGWVEHQLFNSLRTRLSFMGNYDSYDVGHVDTTTGRASMSYNKMLPEGGNVNFLISDSYEVKDQNLGKSSMAENNEPPITLNGNPLYDYQLKDAYIDVTTIRFTTVDHTPVQTPVFTTRVLGTTTYLSIADTSALPKIVLVTYSYAVNPQITYGTNTLNVNGNLSLLRGRYLLFAQYEQRDQNLLDGRADLVILGSSTVFRGGGEFRYLTHTFGAEYLNVNFLNNSREAVAGYWRYAGSVGRFLVNADMRDTYTRYSASGSNSSSLQSNYADNTLSTMVNVSRSVFRNGVVQFTGNYQMLRGDSPHRDDIILRLRYTWNMGKFMLSFDAQTFIRELTSSSQNNNYLKFEVRRYF
jgi:hypothetical protein